MNKPDRLEDLLPPNNVDAEACLIASILRRPDTFAEVRPLLRSESFYQPDYGIIWDSMGALADARRPIDANLLREHLIGRKLYEEIGGTDMLARLLTDTVFTGRHVADYAAVVAEKAKLRELIALCGKVQQRCYAPTRLLDPANEIAQWLEASAASVREEGFAETIRELEQVVHEVVDSKQSGAVERFETGLTELDALCGGVPIGGQTLIAGKAGMGKSQLCKQILRNLATKGIPVGIVAVEESARKIAENYLAGASGIENNKIVYNRLCREEWDQIIGAMPQLVIPLVIDDAQHRVSDIERTIRRMVRKHQCKVIVVDHLHLIDGETDGPREQEISRISGRLKRLWMDLKVAGIVAAQLNRGGEREAAPELDNLRGSGSLEQDGDLVIQLHRQDYFEWKKKGHNFVPDHRLRMFVNKNKSGPVGWCDAYFDGDSQTVTDWNNGCGPFARATYSAVQLNVDAEVRLRT